MINSGRTKFLLDLLLAILVVFVAKLLFGDYGLIIAAVIIVFYALLD
jgi:hypothetical protein